MTDSEAKLPANSSAGPDDGNIQVAFPYRTHTELMEQIMQLPDDKPSPKRGLSIPIYPDYERDFPYVNNSGLVQVDAQHAVDHAKNAPTPQPPAYYPKGSLRITSEGDLPHWTEEDAREIAQIMGYNCAPPVQTRPNDTDGVTQTGHLTFGVGSHKFRK